MPPKVRFAIDSALAGERFEPSVPRETDNDFQDCPRSTAPAIPLPDRTRSPIASDTNGGVLVSSLPTSTAIRASAGTRSTHSASRLAALPKAARDAYIRGTGPIAASDDGREKRSPSLGPRVRIQRARMSAARRGIQ
jgi:hypothetical protein